MDINHENAYHSNVLFLLIHEKQNDEVQVYLAPPTIVFVGPLAPEKTGNIGMKTKDTHHIHFLPVAIFCLLQLY